MGKTQPRCQLCDVDESMYHIIMECPQFSQLRNQLRMESSWSEVMNESKESCIRLLKFLSGSDIETFEEEIQSPVDSMVK